MRPVPFDGGDMPAEWLVAKPPYYQHPHLYEDRGVRVLATFDERRELGPNALHSDDCPCRTGKGDTR